MDIFLPWHAHIPDPRYIRLIAGKRVMLDVNTLLRGVLFPESHCARLLEHIERTVNSKAVICDHVRDTALYNLRSTRSDLIPQFSTGLLALVQRGVIEVRPNGNPNSLPPSAAFDPKEDDIVTATALAERCDFLSTLDHKLAMHASNVVEVLPPAQPECNKMLAVYNPLEIPMYAGPTEGSLVFEVIPTQNTVGHKANASGKRHVFSAGHDFALWLSEESWRYEIGPIHGSAYYQFPELPANRHIALGISYDCLAKRLVVGWDVPEVGTGTFQTVGRNLPNSFGGLSMLGGNENSFWGCWRGALSSRRFVGQKALSFALTRRAYFDAVDAQRHKISDAIFETVIVVTPK